MEGYHRSVLLREAIDVLKVETGKWYIDATLGDGGHALEILKRGGRIVGIDVDPQALERARKRLQGTGFSDQDFILIRGNFRDIKDLLARSMRNYTARFEEPCLPPSAGRKNLLKDQKFKGALFDLGVSSLQLETPERGFSFMREGPVDMRMDPNLEVKALDLINTGGRKELYALFSRLGEEKDSYALADTLVSARQIAPITTTRQLAQVVERVLGRKDKTHPATKIFQALRIAVNDELNALQEGLDQVISLIEKNGLILVISFHSLEDRIVKQTFKKWQSEGLGDILTKKPISPSDSEINANLRARSSKMRVFEVN